jgi:hypothetical protein
VKDLPGSVYESGFFENKAGSLNKIKIKGLISDFSARMDKEKDVFGLLPAPVSISQVKIIKNGGRSTTIS